MLMDQSVLSGVGNVYRAEVLFRQGVSPFTEGRDVRPAQVDAMWDDLVRLMRDGVRRGRIVTLDPDDHEAMAELDADRPAPDSPELDGGEDTVARRAARRSTGVYVYGREGRACLRCGSTVAAAGLPRPTAVLVPTVPGAPAQATPLVLTLARRRGQPRNPQ